MIARDSACRVKATAKNPYPRAFEEFLEWFSTEEDCSTYLERVRWPKGFVCGFPDMSCSQEGGGAIQHFESRRSPRRVGLKVQARGGFGSRVSLCSLGKKKIRIFVLTAGIKRLTSALWTNTTYDKVLGISVRRNGFAKAVGGIRRKRRGCHGADNPDHLQPHENTCVLWSLHDRLESKRYE